MWDVGFCVDVKPRADAIRLGVDIDHAVDQPIMVTRSPSDAQGLRARLGPDVLDWSIFAGAGVEPAVSTRLDTIRQALVLVQVTEAVVKALECYPIEILDFVRRRADAVEKRF